MSAFMSGALASRDETYSVVGLSLVTIIAEPTHDNFAAELFVKRKKVCGSEASRNGLYTL